jgi:hypothetical protein
MYNIYCRISKKNSVGFRTTRANNNTRGRSGVQCRRVVALNLIYDPPANTRANTRGGRDMRALGWPQRLSQFDQDRD